MKNIGRAWSFVIVTLIYLAATAVGVVSYMYLHFGFWIDLLLADVIATAVVFVFSLIFRNASVYDPYWSVQPVVITIAYVVSAKELSAAQILFLAAVLFWGVRLTANWAYTFFGLGHIDWRYAMLKEKTGKLYPIVNFVGIHLVPTLVVYGCVLPVAFTFRENPTCNAGAAVFFAAAIFATILEGAADVEMHRYRKNRNGTFIRNGLWKYSRHPNYLGEILMWWAIALAYVCMAPQRWYLTAGAFANTLLFLCVSIPMADKRQSRKEGFELYKKQTRMLLPIPKKQK